MKKKKIGFFAPPVSGHLFPMLYIANTLQEKYSDQYEIVFFTGKSKQAIVESCNMKVHTIYEKDPYLFDRIARLDGKFIIGKQFLQISKHFTPVTEDIIEKVTAEKIDLGIVDFITYPAVAAMRELNIPWITHMATSFVIDTGDGVPPFLGGLSYHTHSIYTKRDVFFTQISRVVKKSAVRARSKYLKKHMPKLYNKQNIELIYSPFSIIALGTKELEFPKTWPKHYTFIGHGALNENKSVRFTEQFYTSEKRVLVTTGTMSKAVAQKMYSLICKVAHHFPEYYFIFTDGDAGNEHNTVKENVQRIAFIPYDTYVHHFDIVIHHGGAGILHTCMKYAKPVIVMPNMYDQFDYASRLAFHGLAIHVKSKSVSKVVNALRTIDNTIQEEKLTQFQSILQSYEIEKIVHHEIQRVWEMSRK